MIGIEQDRDGKETRRSERQRNGTESLRRDPKRKIKNTAPAESGRKEDNMKIDTNKYYIVRGGRSGVFFGRINYQDGKEVQMNDVRYAYNDGYACGIEQGIEAERSRKE